MLSNNCIIKNIKNSFLSSEILNVFYEHNYQGKNNVSFISIPSFQHMSKTIF